MTTLEDDFHPLLVGYKLYKESDNLYHRIEHDREYRLCARFLENDFWYELEIYYHDSSGSYYKNSLPIYKFYTIKDFYTYYRHKLPRSEHKYKAIMETEYRRFLIDEILIDLQG